MDQDNPIKVFAGIIVVLLLVIGGIAVKNLIYPGATADQMTASVKNFFTGGNAASNAETATSTYGTSPKNAIFATSSVDAQIDTFISSTSTLPNPSDLGDPTPTH